MAIIKLEHGVWEYSEGDPLGAPGGFGDVFRGHGDGQPVAVKRLKVEAKDAAYRELKIASTLFGRDVKHIVPALDWGLDAESDRYFVVMPLCDQSLQDLIDKNGPMTWDEARPIVMDILCGLIEAGNIVHRDLKPDNVLFFEGTWRIADFGIARFVEDNTSPATLKKALSAEYAAPEQWRLERATHETDVYALGCIIHALMTSRPPFVGDLESLAEQHQSAAPSPISALDARTNSMLANMLRKPPSARPSRERCSAVFQSPPAVVTPVRAALAEASHIVSKKIAEEEAQRAIEKAFIQLRTALAKDGIEDLGRSIGRLFSEITSVVDGANITGGNIHFGGAILDFALPVEVSVKESLENNCRPRYDFDVLAFSVIKLRHQIGGVIYKFHTTLVFAKWRQETQYRWHEVGFYPSIGQQHVSRPTELDPRERVFHWALGPGMTEYKPAYGPVTIDAEDEPDFHDRWMYLFAKAAREELRPPDTMPMSMNFFRP